MSLKVPTAVVKFPSQDAILNYLNNHPFKIDGVDKVMYVPNTLPVIARFFANKEMPRNEIQANIKNAINIAVGESDDPEAKKLSALIQAVQKFIVSCEKRSGEDDFTKDLKQTIAEPANLQITVKIYAQVLDDLLEGATFIPPAAGSTRWTKQAASVTPATPQLNDRITSVTPGANQLGDKR